MHRFSLNQILHDQCMTRTFQSFKKSEFINGSGGNVFVTIDKRFRSQVKKTTECNIPAKFGSNCISGFRGEVYNLKVSEEDVSKVLVMDKAQIDLW